MSPIPGLTLTVALLAASVTYAATPLAGFLAARLGMHDRPSTRKIHAVLVPYLGGLGILAGWLVAFLTLGTFTQSAMLGAGMLVLGIVGFVDDRLDISPRLRLGIQIGVAMMAWWGGVRMTPTDLGPIDFALSILWLVGVTNAFNFMDNMDGLAAGVGGIAAAGLGTIGILVGQQLVSLLGFGLAGALFGFLRHNWHPARIFMGDTGSLPLGFGLAALAVKVEFPGVHPLVAFAVPITILGLFIADTVVMALGRIQRKEPIIGARLDHISHRLLQRSLPVRQVALRLYAAAAGLAVAGVAATRLEPVWAIAVIAGSWVLSAAGVAGALKLPILVDRVPAPADLDPELQPATA